MTAEEVLARLEEAGAILLALGGGRAGPAKLTAQSQGWPVVHEAIEAYGWSGMRVRPAVPDARSISRMDEALGWIGLIPHQNYVLRRIVGARVLISPLTGRHLFTWRRIAEMLGAEPRAVRTWHARGIAMIVAGFRMQRAA